MTVGYYGGIDKKGRTHISKNHVTTPDGVLCGYEPAKIMRFHLIGGINIAHESINCPKCFKKLSKMKD